ARTHSCQRPPAAGTPLMAPVPVTYLPDSDAGRLRSRRHSDSVVSQFDSATTPPRATALARWATWPQVVSSEGLRNRGSSPLLRNRVGAATRPESVSLGHERP